MPKNTSAPQLGRSNDTAGRANAENAGADSTSTPSPVTTATPSVAIPGKNYHHSHHQHPRRHAIAEEPEDGSVSESPPTAPSSVPNHNVQLSADDLDELCDHATDLPCSPPIGPGIAGNANWPSKGNWASADSGYGGDYSLAVAGNNAASIIGRSQSMRSRVRCIKQLRVWGVHKNVIRFQEEQLRMTRKNSTETNGRRTKSDVDADDKSIAMAQVVLGSAGSEQQQTVTAATTDMSVSSSSSSVSRNSLPESPTASTDALRPSHHHHASGLSPPPPTVASSPQSVTPSGDSSATSSSTVVLAGSDSDLEAETECPLLEDMLDWETIRHLKPKEKKRQEVINGKRLGYLSMYTG